MEHELLMELENSFLYTSELNIRSIENIFNAYDSEKFQKTVELLKDNLNNDLMVRFVYFLILFRDNRHIKNLIQKSRLPLQIVEIITLSAHARATLNQVHEEEFLDEIFELFGQDTLLELLTASEMIKNDNLLFLYVLTKLDNKHIDLYFHDPDRLHLVVNKCLKLPEDFVRNLFLKNVELYGYIGMVVHTMGVESEEFSQYVKNFDMDEIQETKRIIMNIHSNFDLEHEKDLALSERDTRRFAMIVNSIKNSTNIFQRLRSFSEEGALLSIEEEKLIQEIIQNPMFSDLLEKYSSIDSESKSTSSTATFLF